jgi:hypothetical protein
MNIYRNYYHNWGFHGGEDSDRSSLGTQLPDYTLSQPEISDIKRHYFRPKSLIR